MENDPNKKESKGKRIFKKAVRRSSKCSNNGQEAGAGAGASRSRSVEPAAEPSPAPKNKLEIHDSHNRALAQALLKEQQPVPNEPFPVPKETSKRSLKRKLEEESGIAGTSGAGAGAGASESDADDKDPSKDKKKKNRCAVCRKKVGLTGFECRCGGLFCAVHRYSDKHECSFDYRELGAQEIRRNNPVVVSQKIHKI